MRQARISLAALLSIALGAGALACRSRPDFVLAAHVVLRGPGIDSTDRLALRDGRVIRGGANGSAIELPDATVAPAFIDHHVHLLNVGMSVLDRERGGALLLALDGVGSLDELRERVLERAAAVEPGSWVLGKGWSQGAWGSAALPGRGPIEADTPVFLTRVCGHAGWANGAALARAGITRDTPDPEGGRVVRDAAGEPTGVLLERANEMLARALPPLDDVLARAAFRAGADALAAQGVVEVFDAGFLTPPGIVDLGADLEHLATLLVAEDAERTLPLRVNLMVPAPSRFAERLVAEPAAWRAPSPSIRVTHLKLFADGALGSRGGALSHAYADAPDERGLPRMDRSALREWLARGLAADLGVAIHAIGDAAIGDALDVVGDLLADEPSIQPTRIRLEHVSYASVTDLERAVELGITLSVQPNFVIPADDGSSMEEARLGSVRGVYAWGTLTRLGATLVFGSDAFTLPLSPWVTVHTAATRRNAAGLPVEGWQPDERLSRAEALAGAMRRGRAGVGAPGDATLLPGDPGDLVVLSANPLTVGDEEIRGIVVHATLRAGRLVWHDGRYPALESLR